MSSSHASKKPSADEQSPPKYSSNDLAASPLTTAPRRGGSLSTSSASTSTDADTVRVRTVGEDLKTGFGYHPALFDLRIRPDDWQNFSDEVTSAAKFSSIDNLKMYAAATGLALVGEVATSIWVAR